MHRKTIIQAYIDRLGAQTYLEIGVQRGHLFLEVRAPRKIAVDPQFMISRTHKVKYFFQRLRERYYEMTSDAFFAGPVDEALGGRPIDVAFIDGLHTHEQVMRDVRNCLRHLTPNGVILLHDCNPGSAAEAVYALSPADAKTRYPGWSSGVWTGDVYRAIVELRAELSDRHVFVYDTDFGVGCIQPGRMEDPVSLPHEEIAALSYEQLAADREHLLNLKPPAYLTEALDLLPADV